MDGAIRETNSSDTRCTEEVSQAGWLNAKAAIASAAAILIAPDAIDFFRVRPLIAPGLARDRALSAFAPGVCKAITS